MSVVATAGVGAGSLRQQLGRMVLFVGLTMLGLVVLSIVLTLPGGTGPEQFLELGPDRGGAAESAAIVEAWRRLVVWRYGELKLNLLAVDILYLCVDTALFIPLYGALFLEIARRNAGGFGRALARVTLVLMSVDLVENTSGLAKLSQIAWSLGSSTSAVTTLIAAALAPVIAYRSWKRQTAGEAILGGLNQSTWPGARHGWNTAVVAAVIIIAVVLLLAALGLSPIWVHWISWVSHWGKKLFTGLLLLFLLGRAVGWLFSPGTPRDDLAAVRRGVADILLRTRYVLVVLVVLIVLTLGLDQSRDVFIGVADGMMAWPVAWSAWIAFVLTVLAVWALCFECWLWARLVCRMPGPGTSLRDTISPYAQAALQTTARVTARVLGLVPAFVVALASGIAARDAVWAAAYIPVGPILTPLLLLVFGGLSLIGGLWFLWSRETAGRNAPESYYDDPSLDENWMRQIAVEKYRFIWAGGPGPTAVAVIALIVAVGTRCLAALVPTHAPLAVAVIVSMLVAWLGALGWLSLKERREGRPWVLAIIIIVGVLGYFGMTDNHLVRVVRLDASGILPSAGAQVAGTLLLLVCVVATAVVLVRNAIAAQDPTSHRLHWGWVVFLAVAGGVLVLIGVDRLSYRSGISLSANAGTSRPQLEEAFGSWADALVRDRQRVEDSGKEVFFVTSEGGGMRAAYWTARVLGELRHRVPDFDTRTFMMSGVSGGAVGEAVYIACLRSAAIAVPGPVEDKKLAACIDQFGNFDVLTPMIGAWLFEDALARVLPTSIRLCRQPGCGFLSRGLWFEQALEQAVPGLRYGIHYSPRGPSDRLPEIFLNSTWVESGDRAIASTVQVDSERNFPAALDQLAYAAQQAGVSSSEAIDMPLSTAAHNSGRFTFVNAIGVLRETKGGSGHLADGGYFDNSGSHTALDVLTSLRGWLESAQCEKDRAEWCPWLRSLRPRILVIQNGIMVSCDKQPDADSKLKCLRREWRVSPASEEQPIYDPRMPGVTARLRLFADFTGPLVTAVNVGGTGGSGRRAEALLQSACKAFQKGVKPEPDQAECTVQIAQRTDGVLYPLGWYLSQTARNALDRKASCEVRVSVLREPRCGVGVQDCDCVGR